MIFLNPRDNRPLYRQIISSIEELILSGVMVPDEQLQSIRSLAMELSLNPNTVKRAYDDLEARGVIYPVQGKGYFVNNENALTPLIARRDKKIHAELEAIIKSAKTIGITKEEFIEICEEIYSKEGEEND